MTESSNTNTPRTVTLPDSGAVLTLKFVGPMLARDIQRGIRKQLPRPTPPVQLVPDGDGRERPEANDADPDYQEALTEWNRDQGQAFVEALVRWGVDYTPDAAAVAELRADGAAAGLTLPADDKVLYVTRVLFRTARDMAALQDALLSPIQPTEAAVAEAVAAFPAAVQGQTAA